MNKQLLKNLLTLLFCIGSTFSFSQIGWVGNMFPGSGSSTTITEGNAQTVYIQVYKDGVTNSGGQGAGIICELYYGEVLSFGGTWQGTFTQAMSYNTDIGNNDEYQATIAPSAGLYEFTCRCSDDGGSNWAWADLPSGNGQLTVNVNPLPVEFIAFEGIQVGNQIRLDWSTASERDNDFFRIEKSFDGINFVEIAIMEGSGTTSTRMDYEFTIENPSDGLNYFRLQQVDLDGKNEFTESISVAFNGGEELSLFPNPAKENLTIAGDFKEGAIQFDIFNVNGRLVKSVKDEVSGQMDIDISDLNSGFYFIQIKDRVGSIQLNQRFIKQ